LPNALALSVYPHQEIALALAPLTADQTYSAPGYIGADDVSAYDRRVNLRNRVSWGAVLAGVAAALVVQLLVNMLGLGIGLSSFQVGGDTAANPTASAFSLNAAIWWVGSGIVASLIGGITAGRLCGAGRASTAGWHGFVSWCAATLLLAWLLTSAVGGILGGTFSALGSTLGGVGKSAAAAVTGAAQSADGGALQSQVRGLVNPNDGQTVQDNITSYIRASVSGDQKAADASRDQAVNSLSHAANITPDEARNRLNQLQQQTQQAVDQARQQATQAAEATRKSAAQAGLYGFAALLLGAIAAWIGGALGTARHENYES